MCRFQTRALLDRRVAWPANRLSGPRRLSARLRLGGRRDRRAFRVVGRGSRVEGESDVGRSSNGERRIALILGDCRCSSVDDGRLAVGFPNGDGSRYVVSSGARSKSASSSTELKREKTHAVT